MSFFLVGHGGSLWTSKEYISLTLWSSDGTLQWLNWWMKLYESQGVFFVSSKWRQAFEGEIGYLGLKKPIYKSQNQEKPFEK